MEYIELIYKSLASLAGLYLVIAIFNKNSRLNKCKKNI